MSPEQIVGSRDIDGRADIYSLGVTIYKLCTGDVPFNASTEFALMMAQVEARPTPPRALRPDIDPRLEEIILKALSKQPDQRYQTVKELTSALLDLEAEASIFGLDALESFLDGADSGTTID
jgi:serine/threonine-protein kinase